MENVANNEQETKQEVNTNGSLMKKTKAQLVEIILRKDALERNLRKDMEGTCKRVTELDELHEAYNNLQESYEVSVNDVISLNKRLDEQYDNYEAKCRKLENQIAHKNNIINGLVTVLGIVLIAGLITFGLL